MVAVFDRRSGMTHLLATPALLVLDALETPHDLVTLALRLDAADAHALLAERLDELVAAGLVEAV